jgi:gliding motility-associated-like protein
VIEEITNPIPHQFIVGPPTIIHSTLSSRIDFLASIKAIMMKSLRILILCTGCCSSTLAQVSNKIPYTTSNGVHIQGVDGTNPVIYDNDWVIDTIEDEFLWLKAHNGEVKLVGNIITRDMYDCNFPKNGPCYFSMQQNIDAWNDSWAVAQQMNLKNVPTPVNGADRPLAKPASGRIEDTQYRVTPGSALIVAEANKATAAKPLVIFVGGNITTVANAYLQDPGIANKVVVFHIAGYGPSRLYNTTDFWSTYTVMKKMKYINWSGDAFKRYGTSLYSNVNITQQMIDALPNNLITNRIKGYWWQVVFARETIGDAPPVLYFFNNSLWKNVQQVLENHQVVTNNTYDYLLVSENNWTGYGPTLMDYFKNPSIYLANPAPNTSPTVSLTSPANNAAFTAGATVSLAATAADANGSVTKVEFFNGSTKLGEDTSSPYSYAWTNVSAGNYTLTAKATDNQNAVTSSSAVNITVSPGNTPPTVTITSPANNASYLAGSNVNITTIASDPDGTVTKVEFFQGATKLGEDVSSPYTYAWTNVPAGTYALTARATDNQNALKTSATVNITVTNSNTPPTATITAPANNASYTAGNNITIIASASDTDGTIAKVEFFNGTTKIGEDVTSPYSYSWTNIAEGTYNLTVRATDNQNATATSAIVKVNVSKNNLKPTVALTGPSNNASFTVGANLTIAASAADADGTIAKVEFFSGNTKLGEDITSPYTLVWNNVAAGSYSLTARATDNLNATGVSAAVGVTVINPNVPPSISLTSPTNNATFVAGNSISITADARDSDGTITSVEFYNGSVKLGEDPSNPYSFTWTNVTAGKYVLTAKATDNKNAITTSQPINITVSNANMKPTVAVTAPANNAVFSDGESVTIAVNATDSDGTISRVEFFSGSTKLGEDLSSPYNFVWNKIPTGSHSITAKATDNDNAISVSQPITISVKPVEPPTVSAGPDIALQLPDNSTFVSGNGTAADGSVISLTWKQLSGPNQATTSNLNAADITLSNLIEGVYRFELTATDAKGISKSDEVKITVAAVLISQSLIPRFFTPNDDGVNDFWEWSQSEVLEHAVLMIFNRFGKKVYEAFPYENGWDGKVNGVPLESDAYYYIIRLLNHEDIKGAVRIIR